MKKFGLLIFVSALIIGSIAAIFSKVGKVGFNFISQETRNSGVVKSESRDLKDFKKIEISTAIKAEIINQRDFNLTVETDENLLESVKTVVEGDTLKIYREGNSSGRNSVKVIISMPVVEEVEVSGASKAEIKNAVGENLSLKANGASKISVSGEVTNLNVEANGASSINADDLKASQVKAEVTGASKSSVFAADSLKADASGASRITYSGEPKTVDENASGASSISKR